MSAEAEVSTEQALGATGSDEPQGGAEGAESGQSPDFGDQVDALRERIDALEGDGDEGEAQTIPDDASLADYLAQNVAGAESGEEGDYEPAEGQPAGEPDEGDEIVAQLDAYIAQEVERRLDPVLSGMQRRDQEAQLRGLADKYPDLRTPAVLDSIGAKLGPLADARQDESLLADPKLVELAYLAVKAEAASSAERPAEAGTGAALERGGPSKPESSVTPEEAIQRSIVGAGSVNEDVRGVLI